MNRNPNSRPDIQVLEDRVVRIKNQVEEFQGLRLYTVSKQRLARVAAELCECVEMLNGIVGDTSFTSVASASDLDAYFPETSSEFSLTDDNDLKDRLTLLPSNKLAYVASGYSPKYIVSSYSSRLQECATNVGCSSGIIQVNQFVQLLNTWYQARFTPGAGKRNPKFLFKADKIPEWIDSFMVAAGNSINSATFPEFVVDTYTWIGDLNTSKDPLWALPYSVKRIDTNHCTLEAVLLEKIIKPSLYDKSFYLYNMHSIEDTYLDSYEVSTKDDLQLTNLINKCVNLTVTSSFNALKYEVSN